MYAAIADTNIFIRAFLSKKFLEDAIFRKIIREFRLVYGKEQIDEFIEVLGYERIKNNYRIDPEDIRKFVKLIIKMGKQIGADLCNLCRDPDDNYIVGLAVRTAKKNRVYLVTNDKDILALRGKIGNVEIVTPGEFLAC